MAGAQSHARFLLQRIAEEAQHATELDDPLEQAHVIATLLQPYSGWALREAVLDCRDAGAQWSKIAPEVGLSQAVLSRQVRGTGPVVTIAPRYSTSQDNLDAQTPLRLAATSLAQRMTALAAHGAGAPTAEHLYIAVMAMTQAQATLHVALILRTIEEVLRIADGIEQAHGPAAAALTEAERGVWAGICELRTAYERDHGAIRMTAELDAVSAGEGPR
ncbi:hypothetical protein [Streptacidiphilus fuscans]|uniref:Uncharacterized protein n=1 Tax=Streptacidiphilus fuscans TaxID=2789292 RepID=A0A931BAZ1_9ACTN|nr:hypothetical protein [Streptacidiphilus fuscans]MBF9072847.1 hypothetical protein [Streptacidiphilus fuscans]